MNIMVSIKEYMRSDNGGSYGIKFSLIPLASAKELFPCIDFEYYIEDTNRITWNETDREPKYKKIHNCKKKSFNLISSFKSFKEYLDYMRVGGKRKFIGLFNVGNMGAEWNIEKSFNTTVCFLHSKHITNSKFPEITLAKVEFDFINKNVILHSNDGKTYFKRDEIRNMNVEVTVKHSRYKKGGIIYILLFTSKGKKEPSGLSMNYEFYENSDKSMPIMINDVEIINSMAFRELYDSFMLI